MDRHSPTPWRKAVPNWNGRSIIWDAIGAIVTTDTRAEDAALIVEAVNEHDRLRDIMRGLVAILETITLEDHEIELLDEAREAIGEAAP